MASPIRTQVPADSPVRCWTKYPSFVKRFYDAKDREEQVYLELTQYPKELLPRLENALPFNFEDQGWKSNLTASPVNEDGTQEPSLMEQIPHHFKNFYMSPFPVYTGVLFLLLNSKNLTSEKPLKTQEEVDEVSIRGTMNIFELYRLYRFVLFYFEGHFMMKKSDVFRHRVLDIFKRHGARLQQALNAYEKRATITSEMKELRYKVSHKLAKPMDFYSEKITDEFGLLSFQACVAVINVLELALLELFQIDPKLATENGFLTPMELPPFHHISPFTKQNIMEEYVQFVLFCNNTTVEDQYDLELINANPTSPKYLVSPIYLFQTLVFLAAGKAKNTEDTDEKKEKVTSPPEIDLAAEEKRLKANVTKNIQLYTQTKPDPSVGK